MAESAPPMNLVHSKYLKPDRVKAKKKGFRTLKMLYFLKIRPYLHTETDYLTKETVLIQIFYENKK